MQDLTGKNTGSSLTAVEWNQLPTEVQNVITSLGQTLTNADLNQLGKAIAGYVANGEFYTDSGSADAYVLAPVGTKQAPPAYTDGMRIRFVTSNPNTGASTVNVAGLGVKDVLTEAGDPIGADAIYGSMVLTYNLSLDGFIVDESSAKNYGMPIALEVPDGDADNITKSGMYATTASTANVPGAGSLWHTERRADSQTAGQILVLTADGQALTRGKTGGTWGSWQNAGAGGGALVDAGSNANGNYRLYADGWLVQWGIIEATLGGSGSTHTYPVAFDDIDSISGQVTIGVNLRFDESIQTYSQTLNQYSVNCNGAGGNVHPVHFDYKGYTTPPSIVYDKTRKFVRVYDTDKVVQVFPSDQDSLPVDVFEVPNTNGFFTKAGTWLASNEEAYWDGSTVDKRVIGP